MSSPDPRTVVGVHPVIDCPDIAAADEMLAACNAITKTGDSSGGIVEVRVTGVPVGLGEPVFYKLDRKSQPLVEQAAFDPPFSEQLFFVFLNDKQDSGEAIRRYRKKKFDQSKMALAISGISEALAKATELTDFKALLDRHEKLLSEVLGLPPVKQSRFPKLW